ncbi:linearmycin resistance permease protein LnrM [Paraliobacillus ryukyuensis]|uniref:ABC-2 type transport system permease protein n=1 Tax=Paraliobacillus ryukyuensis TaxID=200904 RepID=A0A366DYN6_9BACI|nr:ABC transporter permease [Paraliobacillus ryukyuensis]RBO95220.1 ABC-2 type transport system permease protein [Paraliobacillus ryukyuensis]
MFEFLKKDILILSRNRTELAILITMPFILIAILGFALRGIWSTESEAIDMTVGIVSDDHEQEGLTAFYQEVDKLELPQEEKQSLKAVASKTAPFTLLRDMLGTDEVSDMVTTVEMTESEAKQALEDEEIAAIVTLPANFTYKSLLKMYIDQGKGSAIQLTVEEKGSIEASIIENLINSFTENLNFESAISNVTKGQYQDSAQPMEQLGGTTTVLANETTITAMQYYTIGMAVMFALYVASMIASEAYVEKKQHVFDRIILSGKSSFAYLTSKLISTTSIVMIQLFILFVLSSIIFQTFNQTSLVFWLGMLLISFLLATCIGAFGSLLTAITLRINSYHINNVFSGGITSIFAFLGGSFFPITQLPSMIQVIGEWTPNGAALAAYVEWMQGSAFTDIISTLIKLIGIAVIVFMISMVVFPKRRSLS